MYKALFCTANYGLFRIGELTSSPHAVSVTNVHIATNKNKIMFLLYTSKTHDRSSKPQIIKVNAHEKQKKQGGGQERECTCPFTALKEFLTIRKKYKLQTEQFFIFQDKSPVLLQYFRMMLHKLLKFNKFDHKRYNSSSFRVGRVTDLMEAGVPIETIRKLGHWKSSAMYTYLRT